MTTRGNVCPETVTQSEDFYLVSLVVSFSRVGWNVI